MLLNKYFYSTTDSLKLLVVSAGNVWKFKIQFNRYVVPCRSDSSKLPYLSTISPFRVLWCSGLLTLKHANANCGEYKYFVPKRHNVIDIFSHQPFGCTIVTGMLYEITDQSLIRENFRGRGYTGIFMV